MTSFNKADRKINRILRNSEEYKVLLDEESSQSERRLALENLEARTRQRPESAYRDPGHGMTNGEPALLKRRCHLRREEAEKIWKNLRKQGWKQISPVWGEDVDP